MRITCTKISLLLTLTASVSGKGPVTSTNNGKKPQSGPSSRAKRVFDIWTPERRAEAIPRDYFLDAGGPPYGKGKPDGVFSGAPHTRRNLLRERLLAKPETNVKVTDFDTDVNQSAGRIYFFMDGTGYVCSGTVVNDDVTGRSIILTAAHCVYDDVKKAFAYDVLFIPMQALSSSGTDRNCNNDPIGCWAPKFGVVEERWASNTWPGNIPYDWGYYVVEDTGAHSGSGATSAALDLAVPGVDIDFITETPPSACPTKGALMGYSYTDDPDFMYCRVDLQAGPQGWEFSRCGLSGGSSGGPGMFGCHLETGPLMTIVSWGRSDGSAMGGPYLYASSSTADKGFDLAKTTELSRVVEDSGIVMTRSGIVCNIDQSWCYGLKTECGSNAECISDGNVCNGQEFCNVDGYCQAGTETCTNVQFCVETSGCMDPIDIYDDQTTTPLSGSTGDTEYFVFVQSLNTGDNLQCIMGGGTGDADLYVRRNALPTSNSYDCRPFINGNNEECTITADEDNTEVYIMVKAFATYSGVSLTCATSDNGGTGCSKTPSGGDCSEDVDCCSNKCKNGTCRG